MIRKEVTFKKEISLKKYLTQFKTHKLSMRQHYLHPKTIIFAWKANLDIQPVFNDCKAVVYMCAYLSKSEDECVKAMSEAMKDEFVKELDNYEQMKSVAQTYINNKNMVYKNVFITFQVVSG